MTTNTKSAQERTASIDLAQLYNLQNYYSPHGTLIRLADAKCVFMEFARRSLTSGAPALESILNCYSPDDTVGDYQDKIRALYASGAE